MRRFIPALLLAATLLLGGCAETKYVMHFDPEQRASNASLVWPSAPETPRYRYVGQLIGEQNFVADANATGGAGMKLLQWLVGLVGMGEDKVVLRRPQSGVADGAGRVYVADVGSHAVFVFDQAAGKLLVWNLAGDNARFSTPIAVALGAAGQILVSDAELGRVFRLDHEGKPLGEFGKGELKRPTGLARDPQSGRIYVADTYAHDIKVFDDGGRLLEVLGRRGEEEGEFNYPTHLAFAANKLYVTDSMNARVQTLDAHGKPLGSFGKRGLFVGNLTRPKGVTVDPSGNIYVVESYYDNLLVFDSLGSFLLPIGGTGKEIGQFYLPSGLWSDPQGRIYVADMFNGRVVIFQFLGGA